jgi:hypothetical protein
MQPSGNTWSRPQTTAVVSAPIEGGSAQMSVSECLFAATMAMVIVWVVAEVGQNALRP